MTPQNRATPVFAGEAEMLVPVALADGVLPAFGARTRRELSQEQLAAVRSRMKKGLGLRKTPVKNEVQAIVGRGTSL